MRSTLFRLTTMLLLGSALLLSACSNGDSETTAVAESGTSTTSAATAVSSPDATVSTPAASPAASPVATPRSDGTPAGGATRATPEATPTERGTPATEASPGAGSGAIDLATAYANLMAQESFVVTMTVSSLPAISAAVPDFSGPAEIIIEHNGDDRHVQVQSPDGDTVAELWRVDNEITVDMGLGPMASSLTDQLVAPLLPLLDAHEHLVTALSGRGVQYAVAGTEMVNGVETEYAEASYTINNDRDAILLPSGELDVSSTVWAAVDGGQLIQAQFEVEPTSGSTEPMTIELDVTNIGEVPPIVAPSS